MNYRHLILTLIIGLSLGYFVAQFFSASNSDSVLEPVQIARNHDNAGTPTKIKPLETKALSQRVKAAVTQADESLPESEQYVDADIEGFWDAVGLGDKPAHEAIHNLVDMYINRDFDDIEQIEAIVQAPEFYDPAFVKLLLDTYIDAGDDDIQQGLEDLVFLADNESVVQTIAEYGTGFDAEARMASLSLLRGTDLSERPAIREMIYQVVDQESDPDIVAVALDSLTYIPTEPQQNTQTLDRVERSLTHESDHVRKAAISKLMELDKERKSEHLVRKALSDGSESVQQATFQAIADNLYVTDDVKRDLMRMAQGNEHSAQTSSMAKNLLVHYFSLSEAELSDLNAR